MPHLYLLLGNGEMVSAGDFDPDEDGSLIMMAAKIHAGGMAVAGDEPGELRVYLPHAITAVVLRGIHGKDTAEDV